MPTYDYFCETCGHQAEYFGVPSNSHPICNSCGSPEMKRLPSAPSLSGLELKSVSAEDFMEPRIGLNISPIVAEGPEGRKIPGISFQPFVIPGGPSPN